MRPLMSISSEIVCAGECSSDTIPRNRTLHGPMTKGLYANDLKGCRLRGCSLLPSRVSSEMDERPFLEWPLCRTAKGCTCI